MSKFGAAVLNLIDRFFKKPVHPFNLRNESDMSYADWQYEKGADTLKFYLEHYTVEDMFQDKRIVDFGCGEGGKTVYYASLGAKDATGIDIFPEYAEQSMRFAEKKGCRNFRFLLGNAADLDLPDDTYDTVIMNDFMEHVSVPEEALHEALRILRPGGRAFINFPPYYHPYGAHLSDAIAMPWVHVFFSEQTMIEVYKDRVKDLPDAADRIALRFTRGADGKDHLTYINKMTIRRFEGILDRLGIEPEYYHHTPLRAWMAPLAKLRLFREPLNKMVTIVIRKP